ncbi:MAG: DNA mismatch repair endonuclease MutL, partial [Rickettsiales bacterium]|nr:DNA mismatch repair endonuclease MutL [Rickettsiales bacterium]
MAIRVLTSDIVNKIAAGEVIERPASIVKELLENAIDSGATKITIVAENGGKSYVAIQDNGCGMARTDLELCLHRHATSKLPTDNLFAISSLGFRGEAIPSIASIARLWITTNNGDECWSINESGDIKPATLSRGTMVEVSDIFFKIPARLKFLKTDTTENSAVISVVQSLAMSRPDISFNFNNTINFSVNDRSDDKLFDRCQQIFGRDFTTDKVIKIDEKISVDTNCNLKIFGYISRPSYGKSTSLYQHCFVNNRPVKDKFLSVAIRIAYMDDIERHTFPLCALFFEIENDALDVNVHPCKYEVRFKDANLIRGAIISTIKRAIKNSAITPQSIDISKVISSENFANTSENNFQTSFVNEKFDINFDDKSY